MVCRLRRTLIGMIEGSRDVQGFAIHRIQVSEEAISPPFIQSCPYEDLWSPHHTRAYAESLVRDANT